ncbi:hypothetical protein AKJ16_DCAP20862 [Drosera capensis]
MAPAEDLRPTSSSSSNSTSGPSFRFCQSLFSCLMWQRDYPKLKRNGLCHHSSAHRNDNNLIRHANPIYFNSVKGESYVL